MPAFIRTVLLHVPILRGRLERRWMRDPTERDRHRGVVRTRLEAPVMTDGAAESPAADQLPGGPPED